MKSRIYLEELVENKDRRFGQTLEYYPTRIEDEDGEISNALFTKNELESAMLRAQTNIEDIPKKTFLEVLFK